MPSDEIIGIVVAYAEAHRAIQQPYSLAAGSTVHDALLLAAQHADFAGIDLENAAVGVFGKVVQRNQALKSGDRVEIYRPLAQDPKTARRKRAQARARSPQ